MESNPAGNENMGEEIRKELLPEELDEVTGGESAAELFDFMKKNGYAHEVAGMILNGAGKPEIMPYIMNVLKTNGFGAYVAHSTALLAMCSATIRYRCKNCGKMYYHESGVCNYCQGTDFEVLY